MNFKEYIEESANRKKVWKMISKADDRHELSNLNDVIKTMKKDKDLSHFVADVEELQKLAKDFERSMNDDTYENMQDILDKLRSNLS